MHRSWAEWPWPLMSLLRIVLMKSRGAVPMQERGDQLRPERRLEPRAPRELVHRLGDALEQPRQLLGQLLERPDAAGLRRFQLELPPALHQLQRARLLRELVV